MSESNTLLSEYFLTEPYRHNGKSYRVIDAKRLYEDREQFNQREAQRVEPVYVWYPKPGERIPISGKDPVEATGSETVFIKRIHSETGLLKIYIPSGSAGPLDASVLDEKYQAAVHYEPKNPESDAVLSALPQGVRITCRSPKLLKVPLLHGIVNEPCVMLHARGEGQHQFLEPGDSIKLEDGEALPLPKAELETAWKLTAHRLQGRA